MNLKFLFIDNLLIVALAFLITLIIYKYSIVYLGFKWGFVISWLSGCFFVVVFGYALTMIRFWRSPKRTISALENEIVSPADGNIIYIKKIEADGFPVPIKNGYLVELNELSKTSLIKSPCWLIGINMTLWDVHKNCAPINGRIILNTHTKGSFLSLKKFESLTNNERNTYVIENEDYKVGVIQIASKGVRRIDSYVKEGDTVNKGDWLGMIRFGSQVDIILPYSASVRIKIGQQVYAAKTIIAQV
jgi:phosphatidylserine decarboxylase